MADDEKANRASLVPQSAQQLEMRASLVSRGLQEISRTEDVKNMYSWLASLPRGSTLLSVSFRDGSELPKDDRDMSVWSKRSSEMSAAEIRHELREDRCTGLPSPRAFDDDAEEHTYLWSGYIEIEGVHPFERSVNLVGANEKEMFLSAVGILLRRRLLCGYGPIRLYCGGDTLLQFQCGNLKDIQAFIEQANSELRTTVVTIRKPDGTIAKCQSGLRLELTEHRQRGSGIVARPKRT
jgi:hypothetical protein